MDRDIRVKKIFEFGLESSAVDVSMISMKSILNFVKVQYHAVRIVWYGILTFMYCLTLPAKWQHTWRMYGRPLLIKKRGSTIKIGKWFTACSNCRMNTLGVMQPVIIRTCECDAKIIIGDHVGVSGCSIAAHTAITIGDRVLVGSGAMITDSDAHPLDPAARTSGVRGATSPIVICDDVFIGARAIILKGVTIGVGAVVGAGAVVAKCVDPYTIVAGNPARMVGKVSDAKHIV